MLFTEKGLISKIGIESLGIRKEIGKIEKKKFTEEQIQMAN